MEYVVDATIGYPRGDVPDLGGWLVLSSWDLFGEELPFLYPPPGSGIRPSSRLWCPAAPQALTVGRPPGSPPRPSLSLWYPSPKILFPILHNALIFQEMQ